MPAFSTTSRWPILPAKLLAKSVQTSQSQRSVSPLPGIASLPGLRLHRYSRSLHKAAAARDASEAGGAAAAAEPPPPHRRRNSGDTKWLLKDIQTLALRQKMVF